MLRASRPHVPLSSVPSPSCLILLFAKVHQSIHLYIPPLAGETQLSIVWRIKKVAWTSRHSTPPREGGSLTLLIRFVGVHVHRRYKIRWKTCRACHRRISLYSQQDICIVIHWMGMGDGPLDIEFQINDREIYVHQMGRRRG